MSIKITMSAPKGSGKTPIVRLLMSVLEKHSIKYEITGDLGSCKDSPLENSLAWLSSKTATDPIQIIIEKSC
jgi:hypothetical protein